MSEAPRLTPEQQRLVEENLKLARWAVRQFARHISARSDYTAEDAYHDAVIGLSVAATKYDPERGFTFATFAWHDLRQAVQRGLGNYEGVNYRRSRRQGDLEGMRARPVSLERTESPHDCVVEPGPAPDTLAEQAVLLAQIRSLVDVVCRDDRDRAIFDAYLGEGGRAPDTLAGDWDVPVERDVAQLLGVNHRTVNVRWSAIRERIRDAIGQGIGPDLGA